MMKEDPDILFDKYVPNDNSNPDYVYNAKPFSFNKDDYYQPYSNKYSFIKSPGNSSNVDASSNQSLNYSNVDSSMKPPMYPYTDSTTMESSEKIDQDTLSYEQLQAANRIINNKQNVFITGAAGTGKSYLLKYLIQELKIRSKLVGNVSITASTGIAASHIDGTTLHSYAGIGLGYEPVETLLEDILEKISIRKRWKQTNYLIIDEISMLNSEIFDKLEYIARKVRENELPFGGICLILCGDFFQLPPVKLGSSNNNFIFKSNAWKVCCIETIELKEIIRQGNDRKFIQVLNEIRLGDYSIETMNILNACHISRKPIPNDHILPTKLYCYNKEVDTYNNQMLMKLQYPEFIYTVTDKWLDKPKMLSQEKVLLDMIEKKATSLLILKVNAQVMLTRNMPKLNLVNGSRGIIIDFVCDDCEEEYDEFYSNINHNNNNNYNNNNNNNHTNNENTNTNNTDNNNVDNTLLFPKVRFDNGVILVVRLQIVTQSNVYGILSRHYIPLKLAWAFTIHKSQGMTISRAEVNVHNAFESGQVYVALSRIQSLEGLWLSGCAITKQDIIVNNEVLQMHYNSNNTQSHYQSNMNNTCTNNTINTTNNTYTNINDIKYSSINTFCSDNTSLSMCTDASSINTIPHNSHIDNNISNNNINNTFIYDFVPHEFDFTIDVDSINSSYRNISRKLDLNSNASTYINSSLHSNTYMNNIDNTTRNTYINNIDNITSNSSMNNINKTNIYNSSNNNLNNISNNDLNTTRNNNNDKHITKVNCSNNNHTLSPTKIYREAILYFDGGSLGNPGKSGAGYQLFDMNKQLIQENAIRMNGIYTNNQAEYIGLVHGLKAGIRYHINTLHVYGDSELIIKQMKGEYRVRNEILLKLHNECLYSKNLYTQIDFNWIQRDQNKGADKLSKLAMHHEEQAKETAAWFCTTN